jgi:hypothetical protein
MQVGQCTEQRSEGRDRLARGQVPSITEEPVETAAGHLVKDQRELAAGKGDGTVLANQVLVPEPDENGIHLRCLGLALGHVIDLEDPQSDMSVVGVANGRPSRSETI